MDVNAYRNLIMSRAKGGIVLREFSDEELLEFVQTELTPNRREAVIVRFGCARSYAETGRIMGISTSGARQLIFGSVGAFLRPENGFRING